jgi:hypothetical protein
MDRKIEEKTHQKNAILTQLKNVQINVQRFCPTKNFQKNHFFKTNILAPKMQRLNSFLKFIFLIFGKTGKKKIIFTKSILDIFIFVHFEKVDPSFVFTFLCRGTICSKRVPTFL